jgi:hypothetical protein
MKATAAINSIIQQLPAGPGGDPICPLLVSKLVAHPPMTPASRRVSVGG